VAGSGGLQVPETKTGRECHKGTENANAIRLSIFPIDSIHGRLKYMLLPLANENEIRYTHSDCSRGRRGENACEQQNQASFK